MESAQTKKRFIENSSFYTNCENEDPFAKMKIDDCDFLDEVPNRSNCPKCNKSRKYYCYTCYIAVDKVAKRLPLVHLPVQIDIIKHPKEVDGKSTSAHAAVLAPGHVNVHIYPNFPSYENEKVLLIFPGPSAVPLEQWWRSQMDRNCTTGTQKIPSSSVNGRDESSTTDSHVGQVLEEKHNFPFTKVVFIDSTWRQTKALYNDPRLKKLPCVLLASYKSLFWRYYRQKLDTHLSTIEAIYHFAVELDSLSRPSVPYVGQYDNMLFFFRFMYFKIRTLYDPLKIKAYRKNRV